MSSKSYSETVKYPDNILKQYKEATEWPEFLPAVQNFIDNLDVSAFRNRAAKKLNRDGFKQKNTDVSIFYEPDGIRLVAYSVKEAQA